MAKRELQPLIPEDELKKFVAAVIAVPKSVLDEEKVKQPKRSRENPKVAIGKSIATNKKAAKPKG